MNNWVVIDSGDSSAGFRRPGRGGWFGTGGMLMEPFSHSHCPAILKLRERMGSCPVEFIGASACPCSSRSEEHTSELQSRFDLVCRLLLVNKKHSYAPI